MKLLVCCCCCYLEAHGSVSLKHLPASLHRLSCPLVAESGKTIDWNHFSLGHQQCAICTVYLCLYIKLIVLKLSQKL